MNTTVFLNQMKEVLDIDDRELSLDDVFINYDEWDSLAYLSTIAMIDDEYGIIIGAAEFKQLKTLGDLAKAIERLTNEG